MYYGIMNALLWQPLFEPGKAVVMVTYYIILKFTCIFMSSIMYMYIITVVTQYI